MVTTYNPFESLSLHLNPVLKYAGSAITQHFTLLLRICQIWAVYCYFLRLHVY